MAGLPKEGSWSGLCVCVKGAAVWGRVGSSRSVVERDARVAPRPRFCSRGRRDGRRPHAPAGRRRHDLHDSRGAFVSRRSLLADWQITGAGPSRSGVGKGGLREQGGVCGYGSVGRPARSASHARERTSLYAGTLCRTKADSAGSSNWSERGVRRVVVSYAVVRASRGSQDGHSRRRPGRRRAPGSCWGPSRARRGSGP